VIVVDFATMIWAANHPADVNRSSRQSHQSSPMRSPMTGNRRIAPLKRTSARPIMRKNAPSAMISAATCNPQPAGMQTTSSPKMVR
jgi:hypothetical protein